MENNIIAWLDVDVVPDVEHQDELLEDEVSSDEDVQEEEEELLEENEEEVCLAVHGEKLVLPLAV